MKRSDFLLFLDFFVILMLSLSLSFDAAKEDRKVYIVYMGAIPKGDYSPSSHHISMLQAVLQQSAAANYLISSYKRSFNGFSANLTDEEAKKLASMKGVVSVFPSKVYKLQTTRSWDFMGFNQTVNRNPTVESDVVVGVIDSGIWPESKSFSDEGFGPPPQKWKGSCAGGDDFACNNKLIGARVYITDSTWDEDGHGTHTASTAAGNNVEGASFFGFANGTARGAVPSARIAAYKVCDDKKCDSDGIMRAFDDAVADGVDLITISIGTDSPSEFNLEPVAIGAFHAAQKGVLVVQAAGNNGASGLQSTSSLAPWILSVAASSTDRTFIDKVVLGNGETLTGFSINPFSLNNTKFQLVYGLEATNTCGEDDARFCTTDCLDVNLVTDKIVLCDLIGGQDEAHDAGAAGSIFLSASDNSSIVVPLPALALSPSNYDSIKAYQKSTLLPEAEILSSETIENSAAPVVAPFSSRGPNFLVPDILKPDISAPGVDILAAYSPEAAPSTAISDERRVEYSIISGTSMACPHVAGVAAYVKTFHPDWSPSAIRSALMTTAIPMDPSNNPDGEFAYGSGHVDPVKAIDPGLVYDTVEGDYVRFLCGLGYDEDMVRQISGDNTTTCPELADTPLPIEFNYPSLTAEVLPSDKFTVTFERTVTNVGIASSTYNVEISENPNLDIEVDPEVLSFNSLNEKTSYSVVISGNPLSNSSMTSASLVWSDGIHKVRSPIVIHTYKGVARPAKIPRLKIL